MAISRPRHFAREHRREPAAMMAFAVYVAVFSVAGVHSREGVATGLTALVLVSFLTLPFTVVTSLVVVRMTKC